MPKIGSERWAAGALLRMLREIRVAETHMAAFNKIQRELSDAGYETTPRFYGMLGDRHDGMFSLDSDSFEEHVVLSRPEKISLAEYHERKSVRKNVTRKLDRGKSRKVLAMLGAKHNWTCQYCQKPGGPGLGPDGKPWHVDHRIPRSRMGGNGDDNLTISCAKCNIQKKDRTPEEYADWKSRRSTRA